MKYTKVQYNSAKKVNNIYNFIGCITIIGTFLSLILWIWIPEIGGRLFASFLILFIGALTLYSISTSRTITNEYEKENSL